jgi:hypothetical protein
LDGVIYPRLARLWNWLRSPRPDVQNQPGGQAHPDQDTLDALNAIERDVQELLTIVRTMQGNLPTQQSQRQLQGQAFNSVVAALNAAAGAL